MSQDLKAELKTALLQKAFERGLIEPMAYFQESARERVAHNYSFGFQSAGCLAVSAVLYAFTNSWLVAGSVVLLGSQTILTKYRKTDAALIAINEGRPYEFLDPKEQQRYLAIAEVTSLPLPIEHIEADDLMLPPIIQAPPQAALPHPEGTTFDASHASPPEQMTQSSSIAAALGNSTDVERPNNGSGITITPSYANPGNTLVNASAGANLTTGNSATLSSKVNNPTQHELDVRPANTASAIAAQPAPVTPISTGINVQPHSNSSEATTIPGVSSQQPLAERRHNLLKALRSHESGWLASTVLTPVFLVCGDSGAGKTQVMAACLMLKKILVPNGLKQIIVADPHAQKNRQRWSLATDAIVGANDDYVGIAKEFKFYRERVKATTEHASDYGAMVWDEASHYVGSLPLPKDESFIIRLLTDNRKANELHIVGAHGDALGLLGGTAQSGGAQMVEEGLPTLRMWAELAELGDKHPTWQGRLLRMFKDPYTGKAAEVNVSIPLWFRVENLAKAFPEYATQPESSIRVVHEIPQAAIDQAVESPSNPPGPKPSNDDLPLKGHSFSERELQALVKFIQHPDFVRDGKPLQGAIIEQVW
ncbi:MAG: hypothetical protein AAGF24_16050, partial [Cyanobacteria bacterium P01_H01_bin.121]